jgi:hypothetical protein
VTALEKGDQEESISNGSQDLYGSFAGGNRNLVPISSLQVVLMEGESNRIHDAESTAYRVEAERLFNIGVNLGCTTNEFWLSFLS